MVDNRPYIGGAEIGICFRTKEAKMVTNRTTLTHAERALATLLLGGVPGCQRIVATGRVRPEEARRAYEWLRYLAVRAEEPDRGAIDTLYLALSIVESDQPEPAETLGMAA